MSSAQVFPIDKLWYIANVTAGTRYIGSSYRHVQFDMTKKARLYKTLTSAREQLCTINEDLRVHGSWASGWQHGDKIEIREAEVIFK